MKPPTVIDVVKRKKTSTPIKIIAIATVTAGVALSTRRAGNDCPQIDHHETPVATYPVDRSALSYRILPSNTRAFGTSIVSLAVDAADPQADHAVEQSASAYQKKLDDQTAWGSRQRPVALRAGRSTGFTPPVRTKIVRSDLPIVPGIEDPHRWHELDNDQPDTKIVFASAEQSALSQTGAMVESALMVEPAAMLETEPSLDTADRLPMLVDKESDWGIPAETTPPLWSAAGSAASGIAIPTKQKARAWETGRY